MAVSRLLGVPGVGVDRMGDAADLRPYPAAVEATRAAIAGDDANRYLPFPGHERLRRAVAGHVGRGEHEVDWRRTLITAGGLMTRGERRGSAPAGMAGAGASRESSLDCRPTRLDAAVMTQPSRKITVHSECVKRKLFRIERKGSVWVEREIAAMTASGD